MIIPDLLMKILRKQPPQQDFFPKVSRHVSEHIFHYDSGYFGFTLKFEGIPFEGVNDGHLIAANETLKRVLNAAGKQYGSRLGLWTTIQRQEIGLNHKYEFSSNFCKEFSEHYIKEFGGKNYYENLFYITAVLKYTDFSDGLEEAQELLELMVKGLSLFEPQPLSVYGNDSGVTFSEAYQFLGTLCNGGLREEIPLTASAAYKVIPSADLHFGTDILEIRSAGHRKFATCYDLKDFGKSKIMVLLPVLSLPCEFTLTQSFVFTENAEMQTAINKQNNALISANDQATDQQEELLIGKGELAAGRTMFGDYSASLVVYGKTEKAADRNGSAAVTAFLNAHSFRFVRATGSMPSTFFSQIPGYRQRPRMIPKTTTNLATVFGMHNYPQGKSWGNPIGDGSPVMPLKTLSNTLFNLSLHYSLKDLNMVGKKIAGHTLITGATGTGKTALETAVLAFMERFNPYMFVLDLDRGMEIFVRALGGSYFALEEGVDSGLNPFQLPDLPKNRSFLYRLVNLCAGGADASEERQIKLAVDTLYELASEHRNFSTLLDNLPFSTSKNSLRTRLSKWCRSENGEYAWCLDSLQNRFNPDAFYRIGMDATCILKKDYVPTGPVLSYLFYLKEIMSERVAREGSLLASVIAEFWYADRFDITSELMLKTLKTGRKLGEFMILDSQSPEDAANSPNAAAIVQQTPTKIFLPNPDAGKDAYMKCGLTDKEAEEVIKLHPLSRTFLIKQGKQSTLATLDLHEFDKELIVLSGTSENVAHLHRIIEETGSEDPEVWLPLLYQTVLGEATANTA
ncbi:conjugal transfer protein [Neisseria dumasiana]|uniref:Conjugal transfer protein n=1 Tax=Neisseria dumasiana TaxID=1931275 RepID=A0A1X3DJB0_9NEIS|nr:conjugal transfer protein [Neisseria dumasiana]OSI23529.1 conjugal transfer protein [Neisseria dumasiana]